jgi:hypothetical protein
MNEPATGSNPPPPCACGFLDRAADNPDVPIRFDKGLNEFHLVHKNPSSYFLIYYCPLCGGAAAKSRREKFFATIPVEEKTRLGALTHGIKTIEEAIAKLGQPEEDNPAGVMVEKGGDTEHPPTVEKFRQLIYSNLSKVAHVYVVDYRKEKVRISFQGKEIGDVKKGA